MVIKSPKDFWAGVMFITFGAGMGVIALKNYQMGSAVRMGPAYFPVVLGGILAVLGLILQQAVRTQFGPTNKEVSNPSWMSGFFEVGGITITYNRLWIIVFSIVVFVKGLTLPFQICPEIIEDFCRF